MHIMRDIIHKCVWDNVIKTTKDRHKKHYISG